MFVKLLLSLSFYNFYPKNGTSSTLDDRIRTQTTVYNERFSSTRIYAQEEATRVDVSKSWGPRLVKVEGDVMGRPSVVFPRMT